MNRKDLRTSEQDWRATKQRSKPYKAPKKSLKLKTVLGVILMVISLVLLLTTLHESQKKCESVLDDSIYCVD